MESANKRNSIQFYMIDKATIARIMDATNIVDVVSEFVSLKKVGANYKGLCPFHDDKTPSFYVSPARGICHCFSCGKGGNAINFIMEHEQMTYVEALKWLARKYNIEIKERELSDEEKKHESERESMFIINEWVNSYFQDILHNDVDGVAVGMQYFRQRGFRDDTIKRFQLGFDPTDRYRLAKTALQNGYKAEFLLKAGICYQNDHGELVDRYAGRVVFPWIGMNGKVVGFTARVLDSRTKGVNQKYVNSPDSEIYHKANELYGIYQAKRAISKENHVYLVEGQADVISMNQCGIENVVAGSGTALSLNQIRMLHRFTQNITLIYDDDAAGHHAALEGTDKLLAESMNLKILLLPGGMDPDEFARSHTADEFKQYIMEHETDFIQFKSSVLLKGVTDPIKRSEAINSVVKSISVITDQIIRATYIHDCASIFGITEETLVSQMNRMIRSGKDEQQKAEEREARQEQQTGSARQTAPPLNKDNNQEIEQQLIRMVLRYGERLITVQDVDNNDVTLPLAQYIALDLGGDNLKFHNDLYNRILEEANEHLNDNDFTCEAYFTKHSDHEISDIAVQMCIDHYQLSKSLRIEVTDVKLRDTVFKLILNFRMRFIETKLKELSTAISSLNSTDDKLMELMAEYSKFQDIRNQMAKEMGTDLIM